MSCFGARSVARPKTLVAVGRQAAIADIAGGLVWPLRPGDTRDRGGRRLFSSARGGHTIAGVGRKITARAIGAAGWDNQLVAGFA